jgi:hypothetical protein
MNSQSCGMLGFSAILQGSRLAVRPMDWLNALL